MHQKQKLLQKLSILLSVYKLQMLDCGVDGTCRCANLQSISEHYPCRNADLLHAFGLQLKNAAQISVKKPQQFYACGKGHVLLEISL
jgi:hypothetical protein